MESSPDSLFVSSSAQRARTVAMVSILSGLGLVFGYARDAGLAAAFGPSAITDAFFAATLIPIMLGRIILSGALSPAVLPVFAGLLPRRERAWAVANTILTLALLLLVGIAAVMVVGATPLLRFLTPGFDGERLTLALRILLITAPVVVFFGLAALLGALLNALDVYDVPALGQVLVNGTSFVSVIAAVLIGGVDTIAAGVLLGGVLQFVPQVLALRRQGWSYRWSLALNDPAVREIGRLFVPLLAFMVIDQTVTVTERIIASSFPVGDLSRLTFAGKIYQIPILTLASSIAVVLFPALSRDSAAGDSRRFAETLAGGLRNIVLLTAPIALWLVLGSGTWIRLVFERGAFSNADSLATAELLRWYSLAVVPTGLLLVLNRAFYARRDVVTPLVIAVVTAALYVAAAVLLSEQLELVGLPIAFCLAQSFGVLVSFAVLSLRMSIHLRALLGRAFWLSCLAVLIFGLVLSAWPLVLEPAANRLPGAFHVLLFALAILLSGVLHLLVSGALGVPESHSYLAIVPWARLRAWWRAGLPLPGGLDRVPVLALLLVIVATALNRYRFDVAGAGLRIEHGALVVAGGLWLWYAFRHKIAWRSFLAREDLLLVLYLGVGLLSGVLNAPSAKESGKYLALMTACVVTYWLVRAIVRDRRLFQAGAVLLIGVGVAEGLFGVMAWLVYPQGANLGVMLYPFLLYPGSDIASCTFSPYGTLFEPNIFGSYLAAASVMLAALLLARPSPTRTRWLAPALAITLTGVALSLTRTVWPGLIVGLGALLFLVKPRPVAPWGVIGAAVLLALGAFVLVSNVEQACRFVAPDSTTASMPEYAAPLIGPQGKAPSTSIAPIGGTRLAARDSINWRIETYKQALIDWTAHPWIGNGPNAFAQKYPHPNSMTPGARNWISNVEIMALHDTGVIGVLLLFGWLGWVGLRLWRALAAGPPGTAQSLLLALAVAFLTLLVAYQATTAMWLGFTWVYLGLLRAGTQILEGESIANVQALPWSAARLLRWTMTALRAQLRARGWLYLVAAVGLATAFYRLDSKGLWGDEVWQVSWAQAQPLYKTFARFTLLGILPELARGSTSAELLSRIWAQLENYPLQFLLVQVTTALSSSEFLVRLPAALLGAFTVLVQFYLGRKIGDLRTGVLAALLLAVAPLHIWYAQDARPYAAFACFSLLSLVFFAELVDRPSRAAWVGFGVANLLNLYTHFMALMPFAAEMLVALFVALSSRAEAGRASAARWRWLASVWGVGAGVAILALPVLGSAAIFAQYRAPGPGDPPPFELNRYFLENLAGGLGSGGGAALIIFVSLFFIGWVSLLRRRVWFFVLTLAWLGLPLLILGIVQPRHYILIRYLLFMQPVYLLLVAAGVLQAGQWLARLIRPRQREKVAPSANAGVAVIGVGILALTFATAWPGYWVEKQTDWSSLCSYLRLSARPGDVIVGEAYSPHILQWCLRDQAQVEIAPALNSALSTWRNAGRNVWYILLDPEPREPPQVSGEAFTLIPDEKWRRPGLLPSWYRSLDALTFPQSEYQARLFYLGVTEVPSRIEFHDIHYRDDWPEYTQIAPGQHLNVRLGLPATAPRVLQITFLDLKGRDLKLVVNNVLLVEIHAGMSGGRWVPTKLPLPTDTPDDFLLQIWNPGHELSAVSEVQVQYATR